MTLRRIQILESVQRITDSGLKYKFNLGSRIRFISGSVVAKSRSRKSGFVLRSTGSGIINPRITTWSDLIFFQRMTVEEALNHPWIRWVKESIRVQLGYNDFAEIPTWFGDVLGGGSHALKTVLLRIRIRIRRFRIFLGLLNPDPDPLIRVWIRIRILLSSCKNTKKNLWFLLFCDSFWLFIFEKWCKCTFK